MDFQQIDEFDMPVELAYQIECEAAAEAAAYAKHIKFEAMAESLRKAIYLESQGLHSEYDY